MTDLKTALWCDLTTDAERSAWLLLGRGYETGVVAKSMQNDLARAYQRLAQPDVPEVCFGNMKPVAWITDREGLYFDKQDAFRDSDGFIKPLFLAPPSSRMAGADEGGNWIG